MPPVPSCTPNPSIPRAGIASQPQGRHLTTGRQFHISTTCPHTDICIQLCIQRICTAFRTAFRLLSHVWRPMQNHSVSLMYVAYVFKAQSFRHPLTKHRSSHFRTSVVIQSHLDNLLHAPSQLPLAATDCNTQPVIQNQAFLDQISNIKYYFCVACRDLGQKKNDRANYIFVSTIYINTRRIKPSISRLLKVMDEQYFW